MSCGHGDLLRRKIELVAPLLHTSSARFWDNTRLTELFPVFLLAIHGSVRATVPLMVAALDELRRRAAADALRPLLYEYFERHIAEEIDHEEWLLQDLEVLGIERSAALAHTAPPAIAALVGAQYYWIHHAHPVALLGFFAVLEGYPPTAEHLDEVQRRTGIPSDALRMLRHHADLDPTHGRELFQLIDKLPLDSHHVALLGISAVHTVSALSDLFGSLLAGGDSRAIGSAFDGSQP